MTLPILKILEFTMKLKLSFISYKSLKIQKILFKLYIPHKYTDFRQI